MLFAAFTVFYGYFCVLPPLRLNLWPADGCDKLSPFSQDVKTLTSNTTQLVCTHRIEYSQLSAYYMLFV